MPYADVSGTGVTFRVWAPNASSIRVFGTFNGWNTNGVPLVREVPTNAGTWSVDVPAARVGHEFKYLVNGVHIRRDPRSRQVLHSGTVGSIVYDPGSYRWNSRASIPPDAGNLVIYEMHAGTFHDPDPNDGNGGTFYDAINKLDHVAALGATAVQLMPVAEFPGNHSWGYNPSDPFAVESSYGGPDGLKAFVDACHARGLAVLLDVVHNHYGPSDLENSLWEFDGWSGPSGGGIYFYQDATNRHTRWGPRPDYSRPEVRDYILDNTRMWLEEYRVDGLRWDATLYMRFATNFAPIAEGAQLLRDAGAMMAEEFPGHAHIAEDHVGDGLVTAPLTNGFGFDSEWIRSFHEELTRQLTNHAARDLEAIASILSFTGGTKRLIYTENHDEAGDHNADEGALRFPTEIAPSNATGYLARKQSTLAAALLMTAPGIPMIFQGQEMLDTRLFGDTTPVDWSMTNTFRGITRLYRDLAYLRRNLGGATAGLAGYFTSCSVTNDSTLLLVRRGIDGDPSRDVFIIANVSSNYVPGYWINFPTNGMWHTHFNSDDLAYSPDYQSWGSASAFAWEDNRGDVYLAPWSVLVLSRQAPGPADADRDGLPDAWETVNGFDPANPTDAWGNPDRDAYSNLDEFRAGTDPRGWNEPRSAFSSMAIAGDFSGWNPGTNHMARIADYQWQRDLTLSVARIEFKFTANSAWSENWGIESQSVFRAPFTLTSWYYHDNIIVSNLVPGIYRFRFNENSLEFSLRRIASADSDLDGLPDEWEAANGLEPLFSIDDRQNPDGDLYDNTEEYQRGTHPLVWNKPLTDYTTMAVVGNFNNWHLPGAYMQQVSNAHYTWTLVTNLVRQGGVEFKFSANNGFARSWAMNGAHQLAVPFTNTATYLGNWNIVVTQNLNGAYRFTFNEQTRQYSMTLADPDTDGDGLPDWWELQYFGSATAAVPWGSPDGDVYSNREEYERNMNPAVYDLPSANYNAMAVPASFNNWNTAPNMSLVHHHLWQFETEVTNLFNPQFKFAANGNWSNNWGHNASGSLPMQGAAVKGLVNNMQIGGAVDGRIVFTFNDQTLQYSVVQHPTHTELGWRLAGAATGPFVITWSSQSNQIYRLLRATSLTSTYATVAAALPATPPLNTYTDAVLSAETVFYRILVNP